MIDFDSLLANAAVDEIQGEFWHFRPNADGIWVVKETASAGHLYGKPRVHMEACTSFEGWREGPQDLKPSADRVFCEGGNHHLLAEAGIQPAQRPLHPRAAPRPGQHHPAHQVPAEVGAGPGHGREALDGHARAGRPVLATCAGLILIARRVTGPEQPSLGWLDVEVARNAWGRQVASFGARSDEGGLPLTFIRGPRIVDPGRTEVLATYRGEPVLVRQGAIVGATFHPELTADPRVHAQVFGEPRRDRQPLRSVDRSPSGTPRGG